MRTLRIRASDQAMVDRIQGVLPALARPDLAFIVSDDPGVLYADWVEGDLVCHTSDELFAAVEKTELR